MRKPRISYRTLSYKIFLRDIRRGDRRTSFHKVTSGLPTSCVLPVFLLTLVTKILACNKRYQEKSETIRELIGEAS